ncbi:sporulation protein YunB [Falsibacillus pallidus]|uniref:Sporulation protein YunB n=1 Tax=Falsibacillus pallidus TaxID=493781 RepID=A0A370GDY5_9BACI|nr:sporulation protein YunB [Falsibacillus pallidus]RDI41450.1 sporulation protein YunB [Falsibacillus pallidus]
MAKFHSVKPRRAGPLPTRYVFLLTFVFFIFSTVAGLWIVNAGLKPTLTKYAESETKKIAALVISKAINKKVASLMGEDLIESIPSGSSDGMPIINFNTKVMNTVLEQTQTLVQENLKEAEKGNLSVLDTLTDVEIDKEETAKKQGIVYLVPLGQATNNALLGNLGPKIPIRFHAIGDVETDIKYNIQDRGINNTFIYFYVHVEVNVQMIIPFATKMTKYEQNIPIGFTLFPGKVPQYYNGNGKANPSIQLPGS